MKFYLRSEALCSRERRPLAKAMHGYDVHTSYIFSLAVCITAKDMKYTELLSCQGSSEEVDRVKKDETNLIWI